MTELPIKLGSPGLRDTISCFSEYKYTIKAVHYLNTNNTPKYVDIFSTCMSKVTERSFNKTTLADISSLFWHCFKTIRTKNEFGVLIKHKPIQSAGGRHPIDVIYISRHNNLWECFLYDDNAHALCLLDTSPQAVASFIHEVSLVLDPQAGDIIWFISQDTKTSTKYIHPESLLWRDAGVALGHMALVAEALELNFCPLGISGEQEIKALLNIPPYLSAVGGCIIGKRTP